MKNFINKYTISILIVTFTLLLITKYYQSSIYAPQQTTTFTGKITPLNYSNSTLLNTFNKKNIDEYQTAAGTYDIQTIASEITSTMLAAFSNKTNKTLPLIANWNVGIPEYSDGMDPLYLINRFTNGEHLVPTWKLDPYYNDNIGLSYYETSIKKAAVLGLPLVFILPSPESALTKDDVYFSMDKTQNPNVITSNGIVLPELSPFGPDSLWNEVGGQWSTTTLMTQIQTWYPNPPLVVFIDEDISNKLPWSQVASSARYITQYATGKSDEFKRTLVNAKWLEKYRQLHEGFKQGFTENAWKQNVRFITRNQLALNMGTTSDWVNTATTTNQYANIWPLTSDGLTIDFDLNGNKTDTVNAPHTLLNNLPFMLEEAKKINPNFTYQLSIDANQKIQNPQRYRGFTQFALWFLRPSIIRQTPNKTTKPEINPLFQEVVDSVELIHSSSILSDFWKNGKLVSTGTSQYDQNIPTNYQNVPREFLLKTDATSPVWAFSLEQGIAPNREWLIYIQSPEENLTNLTVTIPSFNNVNLDTTQKGNFYILSESTMKTILQRDNNSTNTTIIQNNIINPFIDISKVYSSKLNNSPILGNGNIYYVDTINGNNNNDGLSPETAWLNTHNIVKSKLQAGDTILFKRGQTYNVALIDETYNIHGTRDNPITIGAYGSGSQPIITTVRNQDLQWEKVDNNIWKATNSPSYNPRRILINDKEVLRAATLSEMNGSQYKWFYEDAKNILYVYSKVDPSSLRFSYSYNGDTIYLFKSSYINIQDLDIEGGYNRAVDIRDSHNINIVNCTSGRYSREGLYLTAYKTSELTTNILIDNCNIDSEFRFDYSNSSSSMHGNFEGVSFSGNTTYSIVRNSIIKNWGHTSIIMYAVEGQNVSNNEVHNNYITSPDLAYGGRIDVDGTANNNHFYRNYIYDISIRNQFNGHDNTFSHNIIDGVKNTPIKGNKYGEGIELEGYSYNVYNNIIEYNTFLNTESYGILINATAIDKMTVYNNIIRNNIFSNTGGIASNWNSIGIKQLVEHNGKDYNNTFSNNIIYNNIVSLYHMDGDKITTLEGSSINNLPYVNDTVIPSKNPIIMNNTINKYKTTFLDSNISYGAL